MMPNRLAGFLALLAGLVALLVSLPFAVAYFRAYGAGEPTPVWLTAFGDAYPSLLVFASRTRVYQLYGRIYSAVIPLTIPGLLVLKRWIGTDTRLSRGGWRIFFCGALLAGLGICGDYWPDPDSFWVGTGFMLEIAGMLVLWGGAILYGKAAVREDHSPAWVGAALIGIAPGGMLGMGLLAHMPSGPLFGYALFWLVMGGALIGRRFPF